MKLRNGLQNSLSDNLTTERKVRKMSIDEMMSEVAEIAHAEIERNKALDAKGADSEYLRLIGLV
jgi:hypothetical protein